MCTRHQEAIRVLPCVLSHSPPGFLDPPMGSCYQHCIFSRLNEREDGSHCRAGLGAETMQEYAKKRCKELGINGEGCVRINKADCLDRCELGPVMVVYPEAVWYIFIDKKDIDEIIQNHLIGGRPVKRLMVNCPVSV